MKAITTSPKGRVGSEVRCTQTKARVGMVMERDLYDSMKDAAKNDARTVSSWITLAVREKLNREK